MTTQILTTKLYIPHVQPKVISRPRLTQQLEQGIFGRLTLVSAPAGYGKTTLVSSWLELLECPSAWLSLDEHDKDLGLFLTYFLAVFVILYRNTIKYKQPQGK